MFPNVITKYKVPGTEFVLIIQAFRKLSVNEARSTALIWLKQNKLRSFPKSGTGKAITIHGFDDQE